MADTTNLSQFLGDVANAIRTKKGTTEAIPAANFDTEIASIETGADTSDATATADDILQGTTAYIADGKAEGNIQKIEEAVDDTVVSDTIECGYNSSYSSGFTALAYCKRHNLLVRTNGDVINLNTGKSIGSVVNYNVGEFSYVDSGDNKVMFYVSKRYDKNTVVYFYEIDILSSSVKKVNTVTIGGNYNYANIIPNPTNPNSCYVVSGNYDRGYVHLCDVSGSITNLATINCVNGIYGFYSGNISLQYNLSKTKLLIQSSAYRDKDYMKCVGIFDLSNNSCISFAYYSSNKYHDCTWYDDDTLLQHNNVCSLSSSGFSTIRTLTNLKYTNSEDIVHYEDTNLFVRSSYSGKQIIAQVIDYASNNIVSEEVVYSGDIYSFSNSYVKCDNNSVYVQVSYTEDSVTKYKLIDVGIGAEKQITGLIRKGTQYHDTSRGNASPGNLLKGSIAYSSSGKLIGTMPNNGELNYTPSAEEQTIPGGYTSGGTVSGDSNLTASNIKLGVSIFGVEGNLEPDKPNQSKTATPTTEEQVITPDTGYELASVTVEAVTSDIDSNIVAENIKSGITILGVDGSFEGGTQLPDGIFVQDTVPTDVSTESILLLSSDSSDTRPSNLIPANLSNWGTIKASLTEEELNRFDNYKYHFVCYYIIGTNTMPFVSSDIISFSGAMIIVDNGVSEYTTTSVGRSNLSWSDVDVYYGDTLLHASDVNLEDNSLHATIGDMKYTVYKKDSASSYEKILDTKNADATASDILEGKTAFVNNEKLTGTYVPLDTSDADATANDIVQGKTAYVDGEKITGNVPNASLDAKFALDNINDIGTTFYPDEWGMGEESVCFLAHPAQIYETYNRNDAGGVDYITEEMINNANGSLMISKGSYEQFEIRTTVKYSMLAEWMGLTADKIKKGETILGITGTYEGDSPITQEEYDTALETASDILGEEVTE